MLFKKCLLAVSAIALMAVFSHAEVTYTLHKSENPTADEQDAYVAKTAIEQQLYEDGLYDPSMELIDKWK